MKIKIIVLNLLFFSSLTSCSPFGTSSLIEEIGRSLVPFIQTKTSTELVSGGTSELVTNDNYKVTVSIGNQFNQTSMVTTDGYRVQATVQSNE